MIKRKSVATLIRSSRSRNFAGSSLRLLHHIIAVALSAAFVLSLPSVMRFVAKNVLVYWSLLANEKIFLTAIEVALAALIILFSHYVSRSWKDRKLARMALRAGLVIVTSPKGFFSRRRMKRLKEKQGLGRDVMIIGSTGYRTFADPDGDLHHVLQGCREAKIMFLNPYSEGAKTRAKSILDPNITPESLSEQIKKSIDFLKGLKAAQRNVRLKLYGDTPLLKLAILGDYICVQHYHPGLDVKRMPEYVFTHDQTGGSLYTPLYQYFLTRWNDPDIPEYDFDTDELLYRDPTGNEVRRTRVDEEETGVGTRLDSSGAGPPGPVRSLEKSIYPLMEICRDRTGIGEFLKNIW